MAFHGDCTENVRSLLQKAHVQCAVDKVSNFLSCREQLVSAVIQQCNPDFQNVAHAYGENITNSDEMKSILCLTKPLTKALNIFIKHKSDAVEIRSNLYPSEIGAFIDWVLLACSDAQKESTDQSLLPICLCHAENPRGTCKCSAKPTLPIPHLDTGGTPNVWRRLPLKRTRLPCGTPGTGVPSAAILISQPLCCLSRLIVSPPRPISLPTKSLGMVT